MTQFNKLSHFQNARFLILACINILNCFAWLSDIPGLKGADWRKWILDGLTKKDLIGTMTLHM